ncbi:MAG: antibiotic biosynthesis monooxygenase family protein [Gemmatimonadaceae bacterium]
MIITSIATFTMRAGQEAGALKLIRAVRKQAESEQPGTLVYLVHRVLDAKGKLTRKLYFYERYSGKAALNAHLASSSWKAVGDNWPQFFEGTFPKSIDFFGVKRIAAFERPGSIPSAPFRPR